MSSEQQGLSIIERVKQEVAERGIPPAAWRTLAETLYPGAAPSSVMMVWDYCQARSLDPMKKPVHIVPMRVKVGEQWTWRDTVLPGIYEYRTTAHRTGEYLGHDKPTYGPEITAFDVKAPEWCEFTVYRWNEKAKMKVPYSVTVKFVEVCGTKKKGDRDPTLTANGRWERAPIQMMTKCAEAAALREAFPEEIGGTPTVEEIEDHMPDVIDATVVSSGPVENPSLAIFGRISEALRDNIEKGFAVLKFTPAQRIAKINEFKPGVDPDEQGQALLDWQKEEYARQQGRPGVKKSENSNKKSQAAKAPETASSTPAQPQASSGAEQGDRPSGAETSGGTAQPSDSMPKAEDVPWGNQGQKKQEAPKQRSAEEFF